METESFNSTACFVSSGCREPSGIHFPCQAVFCNAKKPGSAAEYEHPVVAAQVLVLGRQSVTGLLEYPCHIAPLVVPDFKPDKAIFFKMARSTRRDHSVRLKTVRAAVERAARIKIANFVLQILDL